MGRLVCWIYGHAWGAWDPRTWSNVFGMRYRVRHCDQCGARDTRAAS